MSHASSQLWSLAHAISHQTQRSEHKNAPPSAQDMTASTGMPRNSSGGSKPSKGSSPTGPEVCFGFSLLEDASICLWHAVFSYICTCVNLFIAGSELVVGSHCHPSQKVFACNLQTDTPRTGSTSVLTPVCMGRAGSTAFEPPDCHANLSSDCCCLHIL